MEFKASQIAEILEGEIQGNPEETVATLTKIEEGKKGGLTFLANPKYTPYIYDTEASIVIVNKSFVAEKEISSTLIKVDDAYLAFTKLLQYYDEYRKSLKVGIEEPSFISKTAKVSENVYIGAFSYIGEDVIIEDNVKIYPNSYIGDNSKIGEGTTINAGVKIYSDTQIGKHCTIHSGSVIGADGFGFAPNSNNEYSKVPQIGNVILEDNVEIGANTTVDRATLGSTIIRKGVKLDNHVQIAHNVEIGEDTVIASQTGIAGSSKIGKRAMMGGQVGVIGHLKLGDDVKIAAQSGVGSDLPNEAIVQGSPAYSVGDYKRSYVYFKKLPDLVKRINELEKKLNG
ncbi:UDP-3-O-(3-hydroxymyristoyl)glucosamine N-acyltransferase [Flavobacteriaceae bacterium UJ101]|nr:UDP-3-O-(3-hydroxymyristoyl)glucosamine N-acyltransferase [Flavobacteriaceae bacterium UJ101]